jgi:hypothetical protein
MQNLKMLKLSGQNFKLYKKLFFGSVRFEPPSSVSAITREAQGTIYTSSNITQTMVVPFIKK